MQNLTRRTFLKLAGASSTAVALAACAPPSGTPASNEGAAGAPAAAPITITMVESWFGIPQYKESIDPVTQEISKQMQSEGLNIEIISMILEDHNNKYPALYASGADFTMAFDAPWYKMNSLRDQGALAPLEDLVDQYGADLKVAITDKIYNANFMNGHLYGVPAAYYYGGTGGVIFREDLRAKYDAPMPTSEGGWPSLEPYLQALVDNEPDLVPFVNVATQSMVSYNRNRKAWAPGVSKTGVTALDGTADWTLMDEEDNPALLETAELLRSWWEKGYVNKTDLPFSGTSQNSQVDYIYPGRGGACVENEPDFKWVQQTKEMQSSKADAALMGVDMIGERAGVTKGMGNLKQWNFVVFNVNAPAEQHQAGIQYFNWLAGSQDNLDLWLMGIDGVNYKKEDGMKFSEIEGVDQARNYRRMWYVSGMSGRYQRQPADLPPEAEEALKFFTTEENWVFNPYEAFEADTKALEVDSAKLNAVYDEAVHGLMTGQETVADSVAKMKQMLDDAGRQSYKEQLQAQIDAYIAANKKA
ncbi:MAG: substrate-binding domain-containing protein [Caldilineaceae bacterium]